MYNDWKNRASLPSPNKNVLQQIKKLYERNYVFVFLLAYLLIKLPSVPTMRTCSSIW